MAVLPTPGSPISTGLFLVRRDSTWSTRRISSSRPITGSSFPCRARSVRSRQYLASAWYFCSGSWSVTASSPLQRLQCRQDAVPGDAVLAQEPGARRVLGRRPGRAAGVRWRRRRRAWRPPPFAPGPGSGSAPARGRAGRRVTWGSFFNAASSLAAIWAGFAPDLLQVGGTNPPSWSKRASSRCSGSMALCPRRDAYSWAAARASCVLTVIFSGRIIACSFSHATEMIGTPTGKVKAGIEPLNDRN